MEFIAHTAAINKDEDTLKKLIENDYFDKIELDFIPTKDNILIWSHSNMIGSLKINTASYKEIKIEANNNAKKIYTLNEILEIVDNKKALLLEIKHFINIKRGYFDILNILKQIESTKNVIQIQSFNQYLIKYLLDNKKELFNIEIGLIINLFKTFLYRNNSLEEWKNLDFIALSSELFEWPFVGKDFELYRKNIPKAKQYAWTWDLVYKEHKKRLENYINNNVDGIITLSQDIKKI